MATLTERERALVPLVEAGFTNREIAAKLGVSENWVKKLISRVLIKLDCRTRAGIASKARQRGCWTRRTRIGSR